jgi:hypothetical protein
VFPYLSFELIQALLECWRRPRGIEKTTLGVSTSSIAKPSVPLNWAAGAQELFNGRLDKIGLISQCGQLLGISHERIAFLIKWAIPARPGRNFPVGRYSEISGYSNPS